MGFPAQAAIRLLLPACLLMALVGCGSSDPSTSATSGPQQVVKQVIDYGQDYPLSDQGAGPGPIEKGYVLSSVVWKAAVAGKIKVCWEMTPAEFGTFVTERAWVQDAVSGSWPSVSGVRFLGWTRCADTSTNSPDEPANIRIRHSDSAARDSVSGLSDSNPRVLRLGSGLDGLVGGMVLNFQFRNWSPVCAASYGYAEFTSFREFCIRAIAIHEFGHVLGIAHEQNREDGKPPSCTAPAQGQSGDVTVGDFDMQSVMNYCVQNWGQGHLSVGDRTTANRFYPYAADVVTAIVSSIDLLLLQDP